MVRVVLMNTLVVMVMVVLTVMVVIMVSWGLSLWCPAKMVLTLTHLQAKQNQQQPSSRSAATAAMVKLSNTMSPEEIRNKLLSPR